eukprot:49702-Alexandrium_andersonii.AAC.1
MCIRDSPIEGEWTGTTTFYEGSASVPLPDGAPPVSVDGGPDASGQGSHEPGPSDASEPWRRAVPPRSLKGLES